MAAQRRGSRCKTARTDARDDMAWCGMAWQGPERWARKGKPGRLFGRYRVIEASHLSRRLGRGQGWLISGAGVGMQEAGWARTGGRGSKEACLDRSVTTME